MQNSNFISTFWSLILVCAFTNCNSQQKKDTAILDRDTVSKITPISKIDSFNRDIPKPISKEKFDQIIDTSIFLLDTKKLNEISDADHINIMRALNTIFTAHNKENFEPKFKGGKYEALKKLIAKTKYLTDIIKVYPEWLPNRGMGFYFYKLNMELYGTPRLYACFDVSDKKL